MLRAPGLYVHLPWCVKKCPYCDFNSHAVRDTPPFDDYTDAVIADLNAQIERFAPASFGSVFFGGGTPSLFTPEHIARILETARQAGLADDTEVTLEANPGAVEHGSFAGYRQAGVNRISLGVQSFMPAKLEALGRVHSDEEALAAIDQVWSAGFKALNIDLMYGLPEQTLDEAVEDVKTALSCQPTHLSHYQLTLEPNTLFAARPPKLPDDDVRYGMQERCQQLLAHTGYEQYEISAYARDGCVARHNLNYWRFGDYLGVGAGAHGKVTQNEDVIRTLKTKHPAQYLQDPLALTTTAPASVDRAFEFMLNRLRLNQPICATEQSRWEFLQDVAVSEKIQTACARGLMEIADDGTWAKTDLGIRFLNDLQEIFLP